MKNKSPQFLITKASGEQTPFSSDKLFHSLKRSGASVDSINEIIKEVQSKLYTGIPTKKIYQMAFSFLRKKSKNIAAKYKLKSAIMELGPSGFPFERYIAEILKDQGYSVGVGEIVKGHCVNHEIDVIAKKGNQQFMIECKFHNHPGYTCDVKIPLYIQARFKDIEMHYKQLPENGVKFLQGWVVTNTKFTTDAIRYGTCAGLYLLGWDYPDKNSLRELIDNSGLYPITCLTTLTLQEKHLLLDKSIVLCKDLNNNPEVLKFVQIEPKRKEIILNEVSLLCNGMKGKNKMHN